MPGKRSFALGAIRVEVTVEDDHSMDIRVVEGASTRTYRSLEEFFRLEMRVFQGVYAQMRGAQDPDWLGRMTPALQTISNGYAEPLLLGTIPSDATAGGRGTMDVLERVTGQSYRDWEVTEGTLQSLAGRVQEIATARDAVLSSVDSAARFSSTALAQGTHKRRQALGRLDAKAAAVPQQLAELKQKEEALKRLLRELRSNAARAAWQVAGDQSQNTVGKKSFSIKIKKGKFRQLVFFSQHRHSVPYFLEGHAENPDSKYMNTLTILTESQLVTSFERFVRNVYVPFLNRERADHPLRFDGDYAPEAGDPKFCADKYYGDQGMHCTPVVTPAVAFTLTQQEHAFFIRLLVHVREPTKVIPHGDVAGIVARLDAVRPDTPLGQLAIAYRKLAEIFDYFPKRAQNLADAQLMTNAIQRCRQALGLQY